MWIKVLGLGMVQPGFVSKTRVAATTIPRHNGGSSFLGKILFIWHVPRSRYMEKTIICMEEYMELKKASTRRLDMANERRESD